MLRHVEYRRAHIAPAVRPSVVFWTSVVEPCPVRRCRVVEGVVVVLRVESASVEAAHVVVPWWRRLSIVVSHVDGNLGNETHLLRRIGLSSDSTLLLTIPLRLTQFL